MEPKPIKPLPECIKGPEAAQRFGGVTSKILSVTKVTLTEREKAYRKQVNANPNRRGPKPKTKRAGS